MNTATATPDTFAHLPLAHIVTSLTNPRKSFPPERLAELAESIRASGVHQPVLVRPLPGARVADTAHQQPRPQWELVSGERRYRASALAGVATIPAMVRVLTDDQVLDIQLIENLQREDLEPLEEAEGYDRLMHAHEPALTAEQIGERIGKSRSYVYGRLKLLDLCPEAREALRHGELSAAVALLIARIPSHTVQAQALDNMVDYGGTPLSVREASALIQRQYMLRLGEARFKITDAALVPAAGSCKACPKRTGANPDLFADVPGADVCTDVACFRAKEQAHTDAALKTARESGATIIEGREAKALVPHSWDTRVEGFLRLDDANDSPTGKPLRAAIGKLMEKEGITPTLVANPHKDGELIAVVDHATATRLLAQKGHQEHAQAIEAQASKSAQAAAEAEKAKEQERYELGWRWAVLQAAWAQISGMEAGMYSVPDATIRALAIGKIPGNQEQCKRLCKLLELGTVAPSAALGDWVREHPEPDRALALLVMFSDIDWRTWGRPEDCINQRLLDLATDRGVEVDVQAVKAQVQADHTAQIKAKKKAKGSENADPAQGDPPLHSAAQAGGVRGGSKLKKTGTPAAPKRPKTTPEEALQGIAAAMQDGGSGGGDCAPEGTEPDGASAVGPDGRATAPDAGATRGMAPGARVAIASGLFAGQAGTVIEDVSVCTDEPPVWLVHLDGSDTSTAYQPEELLFLATEAGARVEFIGPHMTGQRGRLLHPVSGKVWAVRVDGLISEFHFGPDEFQLVADEAAPEAAA